MPHAYVYTLRWLASGNADGEWTGVPAGSAAGTAAPDTMVNMLGFSPMHNADGYHLSFLVPAACSRYIVISFGLASAMENGEDTPGSQPTLRGTLAGPSIYWRVWGTMRQWRRQWRTKRYTSASLRGSDA